MCVDVIFCSVHMNISWDQACAIFCPFHVTSLLYPFWASDSSSSTTVSKLPQFGYYAEGSKAQLENWLGVNIWLSHWMMPVFLPW